MQAFSSDQEAFAFFIPRFTFILAPILLHTPFSVKFGERERFECKCMCWHRSKLTEGHPSIQTRPMCLFSICFMSGYYYIIQSYWKPDMMNLIKNQSLCEIQINTKVKSNHEIVTKKMKEDFFLHQDLNCGPLDVIQKYLCKKKNIYTNLGPITVGLIFKHFVRPKITEVGFFNFRPTLSS